MATKIEWTDVTWNPIIGCNPISEGCKRCYAQKMAHRLAHMKKTAYYSNVLKSGQTDGVEYKSSDFYIEPKWNGKTHLVQDVLSNPPKGKGKKVFVCSMSDLFHESTPFEWIDSVFSVMSDKDQNIYQVLTKRPQRALDFFEWKKDQILKTTGIKLPWTPKPNIWIGVTVENQDAANERIPLLLKIPASKRFLSCEPLLGPVDLLNIEQRNSEGIKIWYYQVLQEINNCGDSNRPAIDWVIVGPETGPKARKMEIEWIKDLELTCIYYRVPFFDKKNILAGIKQFPS